MATGVHHPDRLAGTGRAPGGAAAFAAELATLLALADPEEPALMEPAEVLRDLEAGHVLTDSHPPRVTPDEFFDLVQNLCAAVNRRAEVAGEGRRVHRALGVYEAVARSLTPAEFVRWVVEAGWEGAPPDAGPAQRGLEELALDWARRAVLRRHTRRLARVLGGPRWEQPRFDHRCPVCGALAALAVAAPPRSPRRLALCPDCGARWRQRAGPCPACGEDRPASRVTLPGTCGEGPGAGRRPAMVDGCSTCGHYSKIVEADAEWLSAPFEVLDAGTFTLDLLAVSRGFARRSRRPTGGGSP